MITVSRSDLAPLTLEEARRFDADQRRNLRSWGLEVPEPPTPPTQPEVHSYVPSYDIYVNGVLQQQQQLTATALPPWQGWPRRTGY